MKIIKHTFEFPKIEIVDGELVENGTTSETHTFTFLHKASRIFEELSGKPFMAYLLSLNIDLNALKSESVSAETVEKILSRDFINSLACASYVKIDGVKWHNNRATAEEFKKTMAYQKISDDVDFILKLVEMATECIGEQIKNAKGTKESQSQKEKK